MILHFEGTRKIFRTVSFFLMVALALQLAGAPRVQASPAKDEDFGYWGVYDIEKKMGDRWVMKAGEELRFRTHRGLYYAETHVGASYKVCKYLTAGGEYQQIRNVRTAGKKERWYWDEVPRIYLTPQIKVMGFLIEDRNMLEFRIREDARYTTRYRNMVTLTAPWKWTRFEFQPYTANEIFLETSRNGMIEDRYFAGFKVHFWGPLYGSIYYLRHSTKNAIAKWTSLNVLGTNLKISF